MRRNILLYRVVLGLLLLAPWSAQGQTESVPASFPPPPPGLDGIPPAIAPVGATGEALIEQASLSEDGPDRPTAPATTTTNATGADNSTGAFGPGGAYGFFDPRMLSIFSINAATTWFPNEHVVGQSTHLGYLQDDFSVNVPLYHEGGDTWALSIRARNETFNTQAVLPHGEGSFPTDLWTVNFGNTYAHQFDSGWIAGGTLNVGSASDEPFHSERELNVGASAFSAFPRASATPG